MRDSLEYCLNQLQISIPILSALTLSLGFNIYLGLCKKFLIKKESSYKVKNEENISEKYLELKPIKGGITNMGY